MLKLAVTSILKPLHIHFNNSVMNKCFPNEWKRVNIIQVHKKGGKQIIKNYQHVSLLPICSKIFEKTTFNSLFKYLEDNSYVHQLLSITHEICKLFDANPSLEVRAVFLDISKAFDRVWNDGLVYRLKLLGICSKYYSLMQPFLNNIHQKIVLKGQSHKWSLAEAGVPQGSILGTLLCLCLVYYVFTLFTLMICHKHCVVIQNHLLTILHFHHHILMKTFLKYDSGLTNGKCHLI